VILGAEHLLPHQAATISATELHNMRRYEAGRTNATRRENAHENARKHTR